MPTVRDFITTRQKEGATLGQAIAEATKAGFEVADLDVDTEVALSRANKRKKDRGEAVGLSGAAGETTAEVPLNQLTSEWNPAAKIAGVAQGTGTGLKGLNQDLLASGMELFTKVPMPRSRAGLMEAAKEEATRRAKEVQTKPASERVAADVSNVITALPAAVYEVLGPDVVQPGEDPKYVARMAGQRFGESLPKGVAAGLGATAIDPIGAFAAQPLSTLLDVAPVAGAAGKLSVATAKGLNLPRVATALENVGKYPEKGFDVAKEYGGKAVDVAQEAVGKVSEVAAEKLAPVAPALATIPAYMADWAKQGPIIERAARMFLDPTAHRNPAVKGFTQDLLTEPSRVQTAIKRRGEALTPEEATAAPAATGPAKPLTLVGETKASPAAAIERDLINAADEMDLADAELSRTQAGAMSPTEPAVIQARAKAEAARSKVTALEQELATAEALPASSKVAAQVVDPYQAIRQKERALAAAKRRRVDNPSAELNADIAEMEASIARDKSTAAAIANRQVAAATAPSRVTGQANKLALDDIAAEVGKALPTLTEAGESTAKVVRTQLADLLLRDTRSLSEALRHPTFTKRLQEVANLSDQQMSLLKNTTDPLKNLDVELTGRLHEAFKQVAEELPDTPALRAQAIKGTVEAVAEEASKKAAKNMLDGEASRIISAEAGYADDPARAAISYAKRVTANSDQMPVQALRSTQNPKALAAELRNVASITANKADAALLLKEADRLDTFKQLSQDLVGADHWVDPLLHTALTIEAQARAMLSNTGAAATVMRYIKSNLTARNLKSGLNNLISNTLMQAIRNGDPTGGIYVAARDAVEYARNKKAGGTSAKWNAIERSGILDSNMLAQELGNLNSMLPNRILEAFYRGGDTFFKLGEASRSFDDLMSSVKEMAVGDTVSFETRPGRKVTITKASDGGLNLTDAGEYTQQKVRRLSEQDLNTVIGQAAGNRANQLFFDYADVPLLGKYLRRQPALGLLSPFYSYTAKAIDLPGKAGLATRVIQGRYGWIDASNPGTLAKQGGLQLAEGIRRSVVLNATKQQLIEDKNEELGKAIQYLPAAGKISVLKHLSNPAYLEQREFGNYNFLNPTATVANLLMQIGGEEGVPYTGKKYRPKDRWTDEQRVRLLQRAETGQMNSAADALGLLGVGGSVLTDLLETVKTSSKQGKAVPMGRLYKSLGPALMGGTTAAALDLAAGAGILPGVPTTRMDRVSATDKKAQESFLRWSIRKITGLAWQALPINGTVKSFERLGDEWKANLDLDNRKQQAEKKYMLAITEKDPAAKAEANDELADVKNLAKIVDSEIKTMYGEWWKLHRAVYRSKFPKVPAKNTK